MGRQTSITPGNRRERIAVIAWLAALAACTPARWAERPPRPGGRGGLTEGGTVGDAEHVSVEGRPLLHRVLGTGSRTVLLIGAIHGDEPGSHELVRDFERWVGDRPWELEGLRLVVATPINPDGLERGTRVNANGIDLNRNFPASNYRPSKRRGPRPLSEPEARFVQFLLDRYQPCLVISVHQPRRSVNYDGPAREIAEAMARHNGYRVEATVGYPTPGSLGSWVGVDAQVPIITLELPRRPDRNTFFEENLEALRSALAKARTAGSAPVRHVWK